MTDTFSTPAPRREDARALQAKLYREIGISAVAAALRFTTQPEHACLAPRGMDKAPAKAQTGGIQVGEARAA